MSKKTNTLWFVLGATIFNILVTVICFLLLLLIYARLLVPILPEAGIAWGFPIIFIASIAISFVVYRLALKILMKKINVEEYFDPIFGGRKPPPKRND